MPPLLTFLPGLHGNSELYHPLASRLKDPAEFVNYPEKGEQSYQALADFLASSLDWSLPRVLIAESFSGPLALQMAARFTHSVSAVVIAASFCASPSPASLALLPLRPLFMLRPPAATIRHFLTGSSIPDQLTQTVRQTISSLPALTLSRRVRSVLSLEEQHCPSLTNTPILILQAKHDNLIPWQFQNQLEQHYPHARVHWLESPHLIFQRAPKQCCAKIKQFLNQLPALNH